MKNMVICIYVIHNKKNNKKGEYEKMKKTMIFLKRGIAFCLISSMLMTNTTVLAKSNNVNVINKNKEDDKNKWFNQNENFKNASDDTIVCYMDGVPIKKSQILEDGVIDLDSTYTASAQLSSRAVIETIYSSDSKIPKGTKNKCSINLLKPYHNAIIETTIIAPRYSQSNKKMYMTSTIGAQYASKLFGGSVATGLTFTAIGCKTKVGMAISLVYSGVSAYSQLLAGQIREYTDKGKKVKVSLARSNYGVFYGVSEWTGSVCSIIDYTPSSTQYEKLDALMLK